MNKTKTSIKENIQNMSFESMLYDSSRMAIDIAMNTIEGNPELLKDAFELCFKKYPMSMRAARVIQFYSEKHTEAIIPYLPMLVDELLKTSVDGVKRGFLKILIESPSICTISNSARILDKCMEWIFSDKEPIAVKAYSIDILVKFAMEEPELKHEICLVFENLPMFDYPSLKVRIRKGLKLILNDKR